MLSLSEFKENYPFLSCIKLNDVEYVGIIINFDSNIISFYDINLINDEYRRKNFLELGEVWWWESNRKIPINIFLKREMVDYRYSIKTFNSKDVILVFGPTVNLSELSEKRVKRKNIQLIKLPKS